MRPPILIAFAALLLATARAELPPSAYRAMQTRAPEALHISVLSVSTHPAANLDGATEVVAQARVDKVIRTAAGLKPGSTIRITYIHKPLGTMVGPSPVPILAADEAVPAWLERRGSPDQPVYAPAAGAFSFRSLALPEPPPG